VDTKSLLSDFYGAMLASPAEEEGGGGWDEGEAGQEEEAQQAASAASPSAPQAPRVDETLDLDSERFQPQLYVDDLLRRKAMKELLESDHRLVSQKRALDSDMQMLVYENYNKFISATDMIRKMKANVESMEAEMTQLLSNMQSISSTTASIEQQLTPNREKVENLVGVSRLLKRLEFLFELPGRLSKSIELGAYEQAVRYFRVSVNILSQYSHLKSFADIRHQSERIIEQLKADLRAAVAAPAAATDAQLSNTAMLLDLMEPAAPLLQAVFAARVDRLRADINKCCEIQAVALKKQGTAQAQRQQTEAAEAAQQQQQQADKRRAAKEAARRDRVERRAAAVARKQAKSSRSDSSSNNPFGAEDDEEGDAEQQADDAEEKEEEEEEQGGQQEEEQEAARDGAAASSSRRLSSGSVSSSASGAGRRSSVASVGQLLEGDDAVVEQGTDLISLLEQHFLSPFFVFCSSFTDIVVRPLEAQLAQAKRPNKAKQDSIDRCRQSILAATSALFDDYFSVAKKELMRRGNVLPLTPASNSAANAAIVSRFLAAVQTFHASLERVFPVVPKAANLQQRALEIIELSVRHCVSSVVEQTQAAIIDLLLKLHRDVDAFDSLRHVTHTAAAATTPLAAASAASASYAACSLLSVLPAACLTSAGVRGALCSVSGRDGPRLCLRLRRRAARPVRSAVRCGPGDRHPSEAGGRAAAAQPRAQQQRLPATQHARRSVRQRRHSSPSSSQSHADGSLPLLCSLHGAGPFALRLCQRDGGEESAAALLG
jgi:hypothetical protein